jgi:hypothetical protein
MVTWCVTWSWRTKPINYSAQIIYLRNICTHTHTYLCVYIYIYIYTYSSLSYKRWTMSLPSLTELWCLWLNSEHLIEIWVSLTELWKFLIELWFSLSKLWCILLCFTMVKLWHICLKSVPSWLKTWSMHWTFTSLTELCPFLTELCPSLTKLSVSDWLLGVSEWTPVVCDWTLASLTVTLVSLTELWCFYMKSDVSD